MLSERDFLEGLPLEEAQRRRLILQDIEANVAKHGPHHAASDPRRATQFMPFDALTGFDELIRKTAEESGRRQ